MDCDKDGYISKDNIDVNKLREEMILLISPILLEIVDGNKPNMSKKDFVAHFELIFKNLDYVSKN